MKNKIKINKRFVDLLETCFKKEIELQEISIYTHSGFVNSMRLTDNNRLDLHRLAYDMMSNHYIIVIKDKCFVPFTEEYNKTTVLAGIRMYNFIKYEL